MATNKGISIFDQNIHFLFQTSCLKYQFTVHFQETVFQQKNNIAISEEQNRSDRTSEDLRIIFEMTNVYIHSHSKSQKSTVAAAFIHNVNSFDRFTVILQIIKIKEQMKSRYLMSFVQCISIC